MWYMSQESKILRVNINKEKYFLNFILYLWNEWSQNLLP